MRRYLVDVDLANNELLNVRLQPVTDADTPVNRKIAYHTDRNELVVTDGSGSTPVVVPTAAEIAAAVWDKLPGTPQSGSFGEIVSKKLLTLLNFIGLK